MADGTGNENKGAPKRRGGTITRATLTGLAKALDGMTPREKGAMKAAEALDWIYRWGWSTSSVVDSLAGTGRNSGLGARLVKNGWARKAPIRIVSSFRITPRDILTITPEGVAELTALRGELPRSLQSAIGKRAVKKDVIHDLMVQTLTLRFMNRWPGGVPEDLYNHFGLVTDFLSAHQLGDVPNGGKIPDAIWVMQNGDKLAIELELTPKFGRHLDEFIRRHVKLQCQEPKQVDGLITFFTSMATSERYSESMQAGAEIKEWGYDKVRREWSPYRLGQKATIDDSFYFYPFVLEDAKTPSL